MKNLIGITALTVFTTLFYWYVGQMVPQKETHPPVDTELRQDMTTEELVIAGEEISAGKGTCLLCHTIGSKGTRAPDLAGVGRRAATRREGFTDVEYLAESLFDPGAYIVEGFNPIMTPAHKAPISLNQPEILAVIAYLQSLGGKPSVTTDTQLAFQADVAGAPEVAAQAGSGVELGAEEVFTKYICFSCHSLTDPISLVGPSLYDVGDRLSRAEIYESILDPDATLSEGFPGLVMHATLTGVGFYETATPVQIKSLVDFLAAKKVSR